MKTYTNYKTTGINWIGKIPESWIVSRLSRYFKIGSGTTPLSNKTEYYSNGDINWLITGDLKSKFIRETSKKITQKAMEDYSTLKVYPKTSIVMAMYGATIGALSILDIETTVNQACAILIPNEKFNKEYAYYLLQANKSNLITDSVGGGQPNVSQEIIKNQIVIIPPINDQKEITRFLNYKTAHIDNLIFKNNQLIELLEEKKHATINQAVTKGLDPNVKMKDSGIEWIGEIPEHWELTKIKFIGEISIGIIYSPEDIVEYNEGGTLVLRSSNIQDGKLDLEDNVYVNKEINEKYLLKTGDILICSRNGSKALIGKNVLIDERVSGQTFGAFMTVLRTKYHAFVYYFVNSQLFTAQSELFSTTTINQLTVGTLSNLYITLPDKEEQEKISKYLADFNLKINKTIDKIKSQNFLLQEYRQALISNAVTGKIDVRNEPIPENFIKDHTL